jgi:hypothetical protein
VAGAEPQESEYDEEGEEEEGEESDPEIDLSDTDPVAETQLDESQNAFGHDADEFSLSQAQPQHSAAAAAASTPTGQPAVATPKDKPAVATPKDQPAVATPQGQPAAVTPTGQPAVASPTREPDIIRAGKPASGILIEIEDDDLKVKQEIDTDTTGGMSERNKSPEPTQKWTGSTWDTGSDEGYSRSWSWNRPTDWAGARNWFDEAWDGSSAAWNWSEQSWSSNSWAGDSTTNECAEWKGPQDYNDPELRALQQQLSELEAADRREFGGSV